MFNKPPTEKNSRYVDIVFLMSSDYKNGNRKSIVGFYGFPDFGQWYERTANHKIYKKYHNGNIRALPENIIYFESPVIIDNPIVQQQNLLPSGKKISQQGFNYLNSDNVQNLIALALKLNPQNKKLRSFVERFPLLIEIANEVHVLEEFYEAVQDKNADTIEGVNELEKSMEKKSPEVKQRISSYIERGAIASKVKKLTGYKCLICEAMNLDPYSFKKANGDFYIETHHVEPVASLKNGVLGLSNLITVCANHHRQLHYGDSEIVEKTIKSFKFKIDGNILEVNAIKIN